MLTQVLNSIAEQQADQHRILTGWYLTSVQIAEIQNDLTPHEPHPDLGGFGRINSVPVFLIDGFSEPDGCVQTDVCRGVRFTYIQMNGAF